jgi:hypothetical protein
MADPVRAGDVDSCVYVAAAPSPFRAIGSDLGRTPVASKIAAPTAGAITMIGVSPAPIDG